MVVGKIVTFRQCQCTPEEKTRRDESDGRGRPSLPFPSHFPPDLPGSHAASCPRLLRLTCRSGLHRVMSWMSVQGWPLLLSSPIHET